MSKYGELTDMLSTVKSLESDCIYNACYFEDESAVNVCKNACRMLIPLIEIELAKLEEKRR